LTGWAEEPTGCCGVENKVLGRKDEGKREEFRGEWSRMHNVEFFKWYFHLI
jgi:hypothetical protein